MDYYEAVCWDHSKKESRLCPVTGELLFQHPYLGVGPLQDKHNDVLHTTIAATQHGTSLEGMLKLISNERQKTSGDI